ncbi:hypothetical protein BU24DRAFT_391333 [Aaosphaeria arxii CBS 175.79]|uniref:SAM and PH domain-containing protein n=1 Tax=Aaosphaeria arxii CBS 175.79 TaxID=1450172 RepID=A0A6A5XSW0_9PLEO|nr:uncharacterized protein BU24DRAFT_391333 [Aaosphaeria arxii CBS 175.79]KAF2016006.1 hypothetical protein BU24DRAFT_391333 [Aaosphaeria arxii CBS 175.79]
MQAMTPITPLEAGAEHLGMFQRNSKPFFGHNSLSIRTSLERPISVVSDSYTDIEDEDSEFEEESLRSSNDNRRSQTTISTFEEVQTPRDAEPRFAFAQDWYLPKPVEGPRGPHLFRASQSSNEFPYDFALQLSPLLPKEFPRFESTLREATPDTIVPKHEYNAIASAVAHLDTTEVRAWTSQEVATWMFQNGFDAEIISKFESHDITGAILLDLQFEDLKELEIQSFGKRHQLWNQLDSLRVADGLVSPIAGAPTPFEDISRPCTAAEDRSKSKHRGGRQHDKGRVAYDCDGDDAVTPGGRRRRARRNRNGVDVVMPGESVSIVAIEQLLPKPHKCAKGERCAKWRKQQRQLARLNDEHGFPISPDKGGHIFLAGDPGNAQVAERAVDNVYRPTSDAIPSLVASSDLLGPGQLPEFTLEEDMLKALDRRDPQDNVRQFLALQGLDQPYTTETPIEAPPTPPIEMFPSRHLTLQSYPQVSTFSASTSAHTSASYETTSLPRSLHPPEFTPAPHTNLKSLPRLSIPPPRSMSAGPRLRDPQSAVTSSPQVALDTAFSPCRTASPGGVYRFGTPFSEMDVPVTAVPQSSVPRDASASVPPNMQYRDPIQRVGSRVDRRRPSLALPPLNEGEVFSPVGNSDDSDTLHETQFSGDGSASSSPTGVTKAEFGLLPKGGFVYEGVGHHGWMKKRRTKLLRHEWQDHHFRLNGTTLAMHPNELPSSSALQTIDVDDYAVACSSLASNKLSAKLRALKLSASSQNKDKNGLPTAFEFQLVPTMPGKGEVRKVMPNGKVHHFAVKTKDDRIDWMRELMVAKALKAKGEGYEVNINGRDF